jgi:hypothetical protein
MHPFHVIQSYMCNGLVVYTFSIWQPIHLDLLPVPCQMSKFIMSGHCRIVRIEFFCYRGMVVIIYTYCVYVVIILIINSSADVNNPLMVCVYLPSVQKVRIHPQTFNIEDLTAVSLGQCYLSHECRLYLSWHYFVKVYDFQLDASYCSSICSGGLCVDQLLFNYWLQEVSNTLQWHASSDILSLIHAPHIFQEGLSCPDQDLLFRQYLRSISQSRL